MIPYSSTPPSKGLRRVSLGDTASGEELKDPPTRRVLYLDGYHHYVFDLPAMASYASGLAVGSVTSLLSVFSALSIVSLLSVNSILSVASVNSILSIGCVNSYFEICDPFASELLNKSPPLRSSFPLDGTLLVPPPSEPPLDGLSSSPGGDPGVPPPLVKTPLNPDGPTTCFHMNNEWWQGQACRMDEMAILPVSSTLLSPCGCDVCTPCQGVANPPYGTYPPVSRHVDAIYGGQGLTLSPPGTTIDNTPNWGYKGGPDGFVRDDGQSRISSTPGYYIEDDAYLTPPVQCLCHDAMPSGWDWELQPMINDAYDYLTGQSVLNDIYSYLDDVVGGWGGYDDFDDEYYGGHHRHGHI